MKRDRLPHLRFTAREIRDHSGDARDWHRCGRRREAEMVFTLSPGRLYDKGVGISVYHCWRLPVLNNHLGWMGHMITARRCGVAVPPEDLEIFADAVASLCDDRDRMFGMGLRVRELGESAFWRDPVGQRFGETFAQVTEACGCPL